MCDHHKEGRSRTGGPHRRLPRPSSPRNPTDSKSAASNRKIFLGSASEALWSREHRRITGVVRLSYVTGANRKSRLWGCCSSPGETSRPEGRKNMNVEEQQRSGLAIRLCVAAVLPIASVTAGCFGMSCPIDGWSTAWEESGLYERFPPPGDRGGYNVRFETEGPTPSKMARRDVGSANEWWVHLTVIPNNRTVFSAVKNNPDSPHPGDDQMRQWLNDTFVALDLGPHSNDNPRFKGFSGGC